MVPMDVVAVLKIQDAVTPGADVVAPKIGRMETAFSGTVEDALEDDADDDALEEDALEDELDEDALEEGALDEGALDEGALDEGALDEGVLDEGVLEDVLSNGASDDDDTLDGFA
jgi:hypothetical protein